MSRELGPWFHRFEPAAAGAVPLFCFPHAGGAASSYLRLAAALAPDIDVLAVQYPGRQERFNEASAASLTELADAVVPEIQRAAQGPFALFGHSMGATVGFEAARRLEDHGRTPVALFASSRRAPTHPSQSAGGPLDDATLLATVRAMGGTPDEVLDDPGMRAVLLPPLRADFRALREYRFAADPYGPRLACRIVVMTGTDDPRVTEEGALAWAAHTASDFELLEFPGGHFYLGGSTESVADRIRAVLRDGVRV